VVVLGVGTLAFILIELFLHLQLFVGSVAAEIVAAPVPECVLLVCWVSEVVVQIESTPVLSSILGAVIICAIVIRAFVHMSILVTLFVNKGLLALILILLALLL
jgi:hypothetical protein